MALYVPVAAAARLARRRTDFEIAQQVSDSEIVAVPTWMDLEPDF